MKTQTSKIKSQLKFISLEIRAIEKEIKSSSKLSNYSKNLLKEDLAKATEKQMNLLSQIIELN